MKEMRKIHYIILPIPSAANTLLSNIFYKVYRYSDVKKTLFRKTYTLKRLKSSERD